MSFGTIFLGERYMVNNTSLRLFSASAHESEHNIMLFLRDVSETAHTHISTDKVHSLFRSHDTDETLLSRICEILFSSGIALTYKQIPVTELHSLCHSTVYVVLQNGNFCRIRSCSTNSISFFNLTTSKNVTCATSDVAHTSGNIHVLFFDKNIDSYMLGTQQPLRSNSLLAEQMKNNHGKQHNITHANGHETSPLSHVWQLIQQERKDLWIVVAYSAIIGLLSLVTPLATQGIISAASLGIFTTQMIVFIGVAGFALLMIGIFQVMEFYVVDNLQRRIFVRTAFDIARRLRLISTQNLQGEYLPELVNRFFDIVNIQKSISKVLLDGVSSTLVASVGLLLLAIYHPFFIIFNVILFIFIGILVFGLGHNGIATSIKESKKKYLLAYWLEEIAHNQTSFKTFATPEFIYERVNHIADEYISARHKHYLIIARQIFGSAVFKSFTIMSILGLGGSLVIQRQLTIGQLVAAELVIISILSALDKLVTQFEVFYDLVTALDKVGHITAQELEPTGGDLMNLQAGCASVIFDHITFDFGNGKLLEDLSLEIGAGSSIAITGKHGTGKTTLASILIGLYEPHRGRILIGNKDITGIDLHDLRKNIAFVPARDEIFEGTLEENIMMGRNISNDDFRWALQTALLDHEIAKLPNGIKTHLAASGTQLSDGFVHRIMIARAIIGKPKVLIIDEVFNTLENSLRLRLFSSLLEEKHWTTIFISSSSICLPKVQHTYELIDGKLREITL